MEKTKENIYELYYPPHLVKALHRAHDFFLIDIENYIHRVIEDDLRISKDPTSDTVLNQMIRENKESILSQLEDEKA